MDFTTYQEKASLTAAPEANNLAYLVPGLAAEAGEVAGKFAKHVRGDDMTPMEFKWALINEIGDCLWFISEIARFLGIHLDEVAEHNLDKLADRAKRNKIKGSGDSR